MAVNRRQGRLCCSYCGNDQECTGRGREAHGWLWLRLRQRLGGALTALVVALVTANGGSEQTVGTTAAAEAGMAQETAAVTRVSIWEGEYEVI